MSCLSYTLISNENADNTSAQTDNINSTASFLLKFFRCCLPLECKNGSTMITIEILIISNCFSIYFQIRTLTLRFWKRNGCVSLNKAKNMLPCYFAFL